MNVPTDFVWTAEYPQLSPFLSPGRQLHCPTEHVKTQSPKLPLLNSGRGNSTIPLFWLYCKILLMCHNPRLTLYLTNNCITFLPAFNCLNIQHTWLTPCCGHIGWKELVIYPTQEDYTIHITHPTLIFHLHRLKIYSIVVKRDIFFQGEIKLLWKEWASAFNIIPTVYLHNSMCPIDEMQMPFIFLLLIGLQKAVEI